MSYKNNRYDDIGAGIGGVAGMVGGGAVGVYACINILDSLGNRFNMDGWERLATGLFVSPMVVIVPTLLGGIGGYLLGRGAGRVANKLSSREPKKRDLSSRFNQDD